MKKILAILLTLALLTGAVSAFAEATEPAAEFVPASRYDKLTVATTTAFSGNFFSDVMGINLSDQDVRRLIHGYNLVYWDSTTGAYQFNERIATGSVASADGMTFLFILDEGLTYNDGTPITARDYAFSLLLLGSGALERTVGGKMSLSGILGGTAYQDGTSQALAGFRILGDYQFSITLDPAYQPYFYQLKVLEAAPLPISVLAPGCEVVDDGAGAYISGPFSEELLKTTLLDPVSGYVSHPSVTCGPYMLTAYDGKEATMELNPAYIGDYSGTKPSIPKIIYRYADPESVIDLLSEGEIDLAVRCIRTSQTQAGMDLISAGGYNMKAYNRPGLAMISFFAEKGPTSDVNVRKAMAYCLDKKNLIQNNLGAFGAPVKGYYGIGQWMFMMANGTLIPEEGQEEEWADLTLDRIPEYNLLPDEAVRLLDASGWNLNELGEPYNSHDGGVRCKEIDGEIVPLRLKLCYPEGNGAGPLLKDYFVTYLNHAGISLEIQEIPATELFDMYYGRAERTCDMILIGTNFGDVFDPTVDFTAEGTDRLNGVTDPVLLELAVLMRTTEPGNSTEYCRRWLAFQEYREEILPEIPVYGNAYLDFHVVELQNYEPGSTGNWTSAITSAFLSDYVPEEETADDFDEFQ